MRNRLDMSFPRMRESSRHYEGALATAVIQKKPYGFYDRIPTFAGMTRILIGILIIFAGAQIIIPVKPVPITLQTVAVSLIALTYSPRLSFLTVLSYLTIGAIGVPVFTKFGGGISHLTGSTFGYLVGFLLAAPIMGILREKLSVYFNNKLINIVISSLIGHFIIYTLGVSWLAMLIGLKAAIYSGLLIYIPTGLVKIFAFSSMFSYVHDIKNKNS